MDVHRKCNPKKLDTKGSRSNAYDHCIENEDARGKSLALSCSNNSIEFDAKEFLICFPEIISQLLSLKKGWGVNAKMKFRILQ